MFVSLTTKIKGFGHELWCFVRTLGMTNGFKLEDIFIYFYSICLIQGKLYTGKLPICSSWRSGLLIGPSLAKARIC